jgi:hypothetical protein
VPAVVALAQTVLLQTASLERQTLAAVVVEHVPVLQVLAVLVW